MGVKFNPITGNLDLTGSSSLAIGTAIGGATPYSLLSVDASSALDQLGPLTDGQILIGDTGGEAIPATITGSSTIDVSNGAGSITLSVPDNSITLDAGAGQKVTGILPIANGGTNSSTALNNNRLIISSGSAIVENAALTQGRVVFPDINGLPDGSANLFWDNTNNRLGLGGIATPQQTLHIDTGTGNATLMQFTNGATSGQAATDGFVIGISSGAVAQLRNREATSMQFFTNNLQAFTIMSNGNVAVQNNSGTALATNATSGFLYISTSAGTPTGTPANVNGTLPIHLDSTNNKFYYYSGGAWRSAIDAAEKGASNGVATLDAGGKVPVTQLPNSVMEFKGAWDASTNTPTLIDGTGNAGDIYRASVAGTQDLGSGSESYVIGDWVMYNGTIWQKSPGSDAVLSVNGFTGVVVLDTDDITEAGNLYFTDERAQDAVGNILTDTASIDFIYDDINNTIEAAVLPGGVDHDQLLNFVANEHVDHSTVNITTAANSGLAGGGDITTTRNLVVDVNNATAETSADNADTILIYDDSAAALRKMTRANFLSGFAQSSSGDIFETSFAGANNQITPANITGFSFGAGVRSFEALVSITVDATADLYETIKVTGINKGVDWDISQTATGDATNVLLSITSGGQMQYTSDNYAGFASLTIKFRAITLGV